MLIGVFMGGFGYYYTRVVNLALVRDLVTGNRRRDEATSMPPTIQAKRRFFLSGGNCVASGFETRSYGRSAHQPDILPLRYRYMKAKKAEKRHEENIVGHLLSLKQVEI